MRCLGRFEGTVKKIAQLRFDLKLADRYQQQVVRQSLWSPLHVDIPCVAYSRQLEPS